jgi:hypothetical protein
MNDLLALAQFLRRSCHHYMVLKTTARPPPPLARILVEKLFVGKFREMHPPLSVMASVCRWCQYSI